MPGPRGEEHPAASAGLSLKLAKKGSGGDSIAYAKALEIALCYGWIDSQKAGFYERFFLQRFTPRRARSQWSKINRDKATELIEGGEMQPAGLGEMELAKADGRWEEWRATSGSASLATGLTPSPHLTKKITAIAIDNFKAITHLAMADLGDAVVIAGPNGCGKSSVFDAIRLIKTVYGGYAREEWQHWLSEFQINPQAPTNELSKFLQNRTTSASIRMDIVLADTERTWLKEKAEQVARNAAWREVMPPGPLWSPGYAGISSQLRAHEQQVQDKVRQNAPRLIASLDDDTHTAEVVIQRDGTIGRVTDSITLETVFSIYEPRNVGVVDYHGPQRTYTREQIGGINLNIASNDEQLRQSALYNYQSKYGNIKSELAAAYVRELIARQAGVALGDRDDLLATLRELFQTFFPGKEFLGPEPTPEGGLIFNVRTEAGSTHDINELSSGEKEVLYGYLRLRNTAPRHSILLIDEPELHLNPRLTEGLPDFYHRHLGAALSNQLWLVTHSDAILRQAVGRPSFKVFHMQTPGTFAEGVNQVSEVIATQELERAILDLVGDLAAYRPGAKVVVVEGAGDSEFDVRMIRDLFPEVAARVNLLAAGNRRSVENLQALLEQARDRGLLTSDFYSITDRDFEDADDIAPGRARRWSRFHIENYLLESRFIRQVLVDLPQGSGNAPGEEEIDTLLRECAEATLPALLRHYMEADVNTIMLGCIGTKVDRTRDDIPEALAEMIAKSHEKLRTAIHTTLGRAQLTELVVQYRERLKSDLERGSWVRTFRGRDVLARFVGEHLGGRLNYSAFRDLIVARMRDEGFQPPDMRTVLHRILTDQSEHRPE